MLPSALHFMDTNLGGQGGTNLGINPQCFIRYEIITFFVYLSSRNFFA